MWRPALVQEPTSQTHLTLGRVGRKTNRQSMYMEGQVPSLPLEVKNCLPLGLGCSTGSLLVSSTLACCMTLPLSILVLLSSRLRHISLQIIT